MYKEKKKKPKSIYITLEFPQFFSVRDRTWSRGTSCQALIQGKVFVYKKTKTLDLKT